MVQVEEEQEHHANQAKHQELQESKEQVWQEILRNHEETELYALIIISILLIIDYNLYEYL